MKYVEYLKEVLAIVRIEINEDGYLARGGEPVLIKTPDGKNHKVVLPTTKPPADAILFNPGRDSYLSGNMEVQTMGSEMLLNAFYATIKETMVERGWAEVATSPSINWGEYRAKLLVPKSKLSSSEGNTWKEKVNGSETTADRRIKLGVYPIAVDVAIEPNESPTNCIILMMLAWNELASMNTSIKIDEFKPLAKFKREWYPYAESPLNALVAKRSARKFATIHLSMVEEPPQANGWEMPPPTQPPMAHTPPPAQPTMYHHPSPSHWGAPPPPPPPAPPMGWNQPFYDDGVPPWETPLDYVARM